MSARPLVPSRTGALYRGYIQMHGIVFARILTPITSSRASSWCHGSPAPPKLRSGGVLRWLWVQSQPRSQISQRVSEGF